MSGGTNSKTVMRGMDSSGTGSAAAAAAGGSGGGGGGGGGGAAAAAAAASSSTNHLQDALGFQQLETLSQNQLKLGQLTSRMTSILSNFDRQLARLERDIRPVHEDLHRLGRVQRNIEAVQASLSKTRSSYEAGGGDEELAARGGPSPLGQSFRTEPTDYNSGASPYYLAEGQDVPEFQGAYIESASEGEGNGDDDEGDADADSNDMDPDALPYDLNAHTAELLARAQAAEGLSPRAELIFDTIIWTMPLVFVYVLLDVLVRQQYNQPVYWMGVARRVGSRGPCLLSLYSLKHRQSPWVRHGFFGLALGAGAGFLYVTAKSPFDAVIRQTPALGALWVMSIVKLDLLPAVLSLALVGGFVWALDLKLLTG
ncbi:hypothetical protein OC844_000161 [Tilletia horrida]|nr:hypothetical protein OC844_000161 [Tilletia horrida]